MDETFESCKSIAKIKGGEYHGDSDALSNFRRNAGQAKTDMELIWRIYAAKHWDAICQYEMDIRHGVHRERGEPILGRADDLINYLILFKAMVEERELLMIHPQNNKN